MAFLPEIITGAPVSDAIALTITEQTGDKRQLVLTQRALPYRPVEFSGEQGVEFTKYNGNPIRTVQVLGPEEEPTEFSGFWKERFIGERNALSLTSMAYYTQDGASTNLLTTIDLVRLADDIRLKGQEVVVQWGPEVRRGILKRFSRKWHNIHDAEWTMRFEWSSQNLPETPAVLAKDTDYANIQGTLQSYVNAVQSILDAVQDSLTANVVSRQIALYQGLAASVAGFVQEFADTTSSALTTTTPIGDQQRRLAGILGDVADSAVAMSSAVTAAPAASFAQVAQGTAPASPSTPPGSFDGAVLAVETLNRQLTTQLRNIRYAAAQAQWDIIKAVNPDPIVVFRARQDTDLRDVARSFYGTQTEWKSIAAYNDLTDSELDAGDTVFVPKLLRPLTGGA